MRCAQQAAPPLLLGGAVLVVALRVQVQVVEVLPLSHPLQLGYVARVQSPKG